MYYTGTMSEPALRPPSDADQKRWDETSRRRRILYGEHGEDVRELTRLLVGTDREAAWKRVDLSVNLAENTCGKLSAMYLEEPVLHHPDVGADVLVAVRDVFRRARYWPLMDRVQRDTLGMRETLVHLDIDTKGELTARLVYGDRVVMEAGDRPSIPEMVAELRQRRVDGQWRWLWDVLRVTADGSVSARVTSSLDDAGEVHEGLAPSTDAYGGELPYVVYRAAEHGGLWSPYEWAGLFDATLNGSVYRAFVGHVIRAGSWPQRYIINGEITGASVTPGNPKMPEIGGSDGARPRRGIPADPALVIPIKAEPNSEHPAQAGQWEPAADPEMLLRTVMAYDRAALESIGIDPAAVLRTSSDPTSGVALTVSREAQREAQKQWLPLFEASDLEVVRKVIAMRNHVLRQDIPVDGWTIIYRSLPPTESEETSRQARILARVEAGFMSPVDAYIAFFPGTSADQAQDALQEIARTKRLIQAG